MNPLPQPPSPPALPPTDRPARPALLVSVRNHLEAEAALAGGADVIDVKEPSRGPLGRADRRTIDEIVAAVAGRAPVTAAAGELADLSPAELQAWLPEEDLQLVKCGFSAAPRDWRARWDAFVAGVGSPARCVPVVYADGPAAGAPSPEAITAAALQSGVHWLLVDTFDKTAEGLLRLWSIAEVRDRLAEWRGLGLKVALAGRLSAEDVQTLALLGPDVVGVRGAACEAGRRSAVCSVRVRGLLAACTPPAPRPDDPPHEEKI